MLPLNTVRRYAREAGYVEVQFNDTSKVVGFIRGDERVNVYWTTGTVGTCVNHPRKGKTQLFRRSQTIQDLQRIFNNPRTHTGNGYYRRSSWQRREPSTHPSGGMWCCLASEHIQDGLLRDYNTKTAQLALGDGYFAVQADGSAWWNHIPRGLYNKVNGRLGGQPDRAGVSYIALGPDDHYYVEFEDGTSHWQGPDSLSEELHSSSDSDVDLLAFGPDDGWYVQYEDGSSAWQGIPTGLHNQINGRRTSLGASAAAATVEDLAIGPSGEWFVRYANGSWVAHGIPTRMSDVIDQLKSQGKTICSMRFGEGSTWVILY